MVFPRIKQLRLEHGLEPAQMAETLLHEPARITPRMNPARGRWTWTQPDPRWRAISDVSGRLPCEA